MAGELVGGNFGPDADMRMADSDRERVLERLHTAVAEGRLTLAEFEERTSVVLAARTFGEVAGVTKDLPALVPPQSKGPIVVRGSSLRREGRWPVPANMQIEAHGSGVRLDYSQAVILTPVVELQVYLRGSGTRLTLPEGSTIDMTQVSLTGASTRQRGIPSEPMPGRTHFVVHGQSIGSSIRASYPLLGRRRWWWPWRRQRSIESPTGIRP
jgi:hypothetical protein